jgi:O-antigen chain-terminating methyltransferase
MDDKISKNQELLLSKIDDKISLEQAKITLDLEEYIKTCISPINDDIESKTWLAPIFNDKNLTRKQHEQRLSKIFNHQESCIFKQEIGKIWITLSGNSVNVPNIFEEAIGVFRGCKNILDIGCGDGFFLRLIAQNEIDGYGIDLNEVLIANCKKMGCNAVTSDALSHLRLIKDNSLDGIFMNQVAEHMSSDYLLELLKISYEKLQNGSHIIISIPNIISMLVSANLFYLDPTHLSHIHPEVIMIFLKLCGFRDIRKKLYQPIPDEIKLKKLTNDDCYSDKLIKIIESYNNNINILNETIFGHRDCAIYAKKE